ncbi:MAG: hypothetical protein JJE42_08595 [Burkholderiales bacterium]|nr:hypothetical protein [Burkholderiales bacterium]
MLRPVLIAIVALSLFGCTHVSRQPEPVPGVAPLSPDEISQLLPKPAPNLPPAELVRMSKEGASASQIIARIEETGSSYDLSASEAIELHAQGVSTEVLDHIQSAREQELRERIAEEMNLRERRHAQELLRGQILWHNSYYYDPGWPGFFGYDWNFGYPLHPSGGFFYWRR